MIFDVSVTVHLYLMCLINNESIYNQSINKVLLSDSVQRATSSTWQSRNVKVSDILQCHHISTLITDNRSIINQISDCDVIRQKCFYMFDKQ